MPLQVPSEMWLVKLRWRLVGDPQEMISTIGVKGSEPGDRPINEVAEAVAKAWSGAFAAGTLTAGWTFVGADAQQGAAPDLVAVGSYDNPIAGTNSAGSPSSNCSMLVHKKTLLAGRHNSGRMFVPPGYLSETGITPTGALDTGALAGLQSNMNEFFAALTDTSTTEGSPPTSFLPVLYHAAAGMAPTLISSLVVDPLLATIRRRMRR